MALTHHDDESEREEASDERKTTVPRREFLFYGSSGTFSTWTSLRRHRSSRHQFYQFAQLEHHQYRFTYFHYHTNKEVKR
jgi:hypothetical protein